ncbi:beta-hexosaminidase [Xylaria telfairii]|nr:beta-hexosaminidase [Xylaria telfairii]
MRGISSWAAALIAICCGANARLLTIPTIPFEPAAHGSYSLSSIHKVLIDGNFKDAVNADGETLIPPSLKDFASTFQEDLKSVTGTNLQVGESNAAVEGSIFLTVNTNGTYLDAAGRQTREGYSITINEQGVTIAGASPLGTWWGTRSLLQLLALNDGELPYGVAKDSPGWSTRGAMLDCARHYYPPEFLIEMCSFLSFFKQNEFHIHLSDNLFASKEKDTQAQIWALYSRFRLWSEDPRVAGLSQFKNESYTKDQFDNIQTRCAKRGVTIIPEIEAPAHALVISKWKPEVALDTDPTLLNISHPDAIPTIKTIWKTFLPWFYSKTVHIGADEYQADLVRDYTTLVNDLASFLRQENKTTRIWGTFTPTEGANVSKDVMIQHWAPYEDNPLFDYVHNNYNVINSDFTFYVNLKWHGYFPQSLNKTLIFNGNPLGGGYAPHIFDITNSTNNAQRNDPRIVGHVAPEWNDFGPITSTYLEAYRQWRGGLPAMADKQWGGDLLESEYDSVLEKLIAAAPGQNLDRRIKSKSELILKYQFQQQTIDGNGVKDISGNRYDGISHGCKIRNSILYLRDDCYLETPLLSKGRNYALSFSVYPSSSKPGMLFAGPDSLLAVGNGSTTNVTFITAGNAFPLNYTLPLNAWTDVTVSGRGGSTFLTASTEGSPATTMEFLTKIETRGVESAGGVLVTWQPMAFEAPLKEIGRGFTGMMRNITLVALT